MYCLPQLFPFVSDSSNFKTLPENVWQIDTSSLEAFSTIRVPDKPFKGGLPGNHQTGQIKVIHWGRGFDKTPVFCSSIRNMGCYFPRLPLSLGARDGTKVGEKCYKAHCYYKNSAFSLLNSPWVAANLWLIYRILKQLILSFWQFFGCFHGGTKFQRSSFCHFHWYLIPGNHFQYLCCMFPEFLYATTSM